MENWYSSWFRRWKIIILIGLIIFEEIVIISAFTIGQPCAPSELDQCGPHEACARTASGSGECQCLPGFVPDSSGALCTTDPTPPAAGGGNNGAAFAALIIITIVLLIGGVATMVTLHHRYNILVPFTALCPSTGTIRAWWNNLPTPNLFGVRSGRSRMMDDLSTVDDDPIA